MPQTKQDTIIGPHGNLTSALKEWLQSDDSFAEQGKVIRRLDEEPAYRDALLNECAHWIIERHITELRLKKLDNERATLPEAQFRDNLAQMRLLPRNSNTQKGNLGEIILAKYLEEVTGYTTFGIFRLTYNTNIDQSMKGDDVLLFNPTNIGKDVIYGESKVRQTPDREAIEAIVKNLQGNKKFPVSILFYADRLGAKGEKDLFNALDDLHLNVAKKKVPIRNVGFLLSKRDAVHDAQDTFMQVKRYLNTTNPDLVFIALRIDDVQSFVDEAYKRANILLLKGTL